MARPRHENLTRFDVGDPGILTFPRSAFEAEIPAKVGPTGMCFVGREFAGKRIKILVVRD
jgi:hypothetical protein